MKLTLRITSTILMMLLMLILSVLGVFAEPLQQPETTWVVWETGAPIQRMAWDGGAIWAGAYSKWLTQARFYYGR